MATLENIRKRGVLLSIVIGGSLLAFILGGIDFQTVFGDSRTTVATVDGEDVSIQEYEARLDEMTTFYKMEMGQSSLDENTTRQVQNSVWNTYLHEQIIGAQCAELGIVVTDEEITRQLTGDVPHPMMSQLRMFYNAEKNGYDKDILYDLLSAIDQEPNGDLAKYWSFIERNVKLQMLEDKYNTLVSSSFNYSNVDATAAFEAKKIANISYVSIPYYTMADSLISVSDSEIKAYYQENINIYNNAEETRKLNYITFPIVPSADDYTNIKTWIEGLEEEFSTSKDYVAICNQNSDQPYNDIALSRNKVDASLRDFAFSGKAGDFYAPRLVGDTYQMARIVETGIVSPDSIKVRHILVADQAKADSIMAALKSGANFAELAKNNSLAGTSQNGGELGWMSEGDFDVEFSKACFKGKVNKVFSFPFSGMIQIVEITEATKPVAKVKICVISRKVEASSQTYGIIYNNASQYIAKNSDSKAFVDSAKAEEGLFLHTIDIKNTDNVVSDLKDSRQIVRWAFQNEEGDVANQVFECGDRFVVAMLSEITPKGDKSLESVKSYVKTAVMNAKKADKIIADAQAKLADSKYISDLGEVKTADNASMNSAFIPGIGREPKVAGAIPSLIADNDIKFVAGNAGVYVLKLNDAPATGEIDIEHEIKNLSSRIPYQMMIFESLKNQSEVEDNRINFY
ncbi:MAG: SurA N-terminal domain-containing protein [Paludibacteraceae bacterium]|nr:SurA N-terminal domain-containing protein [Paludibacteraceae bacterium]